MNHHVTVRFPERDYEFDVREGDVDEVSWEEAQAWIDGQYVRTDFEASHPVGTAALVDKVLRIATAHGPQAFANDTAWAQAFARCAGRALGKIEIRVDVANQRVSA